LPFKNELLQKQNHDPSKHNLSKAGELETKKRGPMTNNFFVSLVAVTIDIGHSLQDKAEGSAIW
jgi:hypothetical protein